ncbi:SsrA-binding protein SmpB [Candidatus Woesebacteria bacterium]|nr:SsrA-binding protein SmpB [Candidatus Woesebacteria bacterium]QQG47627.1 MAG: SsrA-binding protein SmpB [Candidatus Woesebacteria bacterium]
MKIFNKKASYDFEFLKTYEAGIALSGFEAKAVRKGDVDLSRSFAKIIGNEAFLINCSISAHDGSELDPRRSRKLLLHRSEITEILTQIKLKKLTLVPVLMYTKGRLVKVSIALAHTKREFEKRQKVKKRDLEREMGTI